jgi:hypothetical protein
LRQGYQAIFVGPHAEGLEIAAIDARDWKRIVELGWDWLKGDWIAAQAVTTRMARQVSLLGRKPTLALFDGEPEMLAPGTPIRGGCSARNFICTVDVPT